MHLNHLKTTFRPSPGPWKNCPLVHGAKKFRDCCFGPSSNGIAVAVMLEMGRWWKSTPCPFSCEQSPPGHCLLNTEDQWLWVSELLRFQCGLGVSLYPRTVRGCVTDLEHSGPPSSSLVPPASTFPLLVCLSHFTALWAHSSFFVLFLFFIPQTAVNRQSQESLLVFVLLGIKCEVSCFSLEKWLSYIVTEAKIPQACYC